jgi:hypothetical protein
MMQVPSPPFRRQQRVVLGLPFVGDKTGEREQCLRQLAEVLAILYLLGLQSL